MGDQKHTSQNVLSFVSTARRLIVVQVIVAVVAVAASVWATYSIGLLMAQQREAEATTQRLIEQQQDLDAATIQNQKYAGLAARVRELLQARTPNDYATVADRLRQEIETDPDTDVAIYTLLATAQYNAARSTGSELAPRDWYGLAFATMGVAIDRNQRRLDHELEQVTETEGPPPSEFNESLYLDRIAYFCAERSAAGAQDVGVSVLSYLGGAHQLVRAALKASGVRDHTLLMRECGPQIVALVEGQLQTFATDEQVRNLYEVRIAFVRIGSEQERPLADALHARLGEQYQVPSIELTAADYTPGVRYFYDAQRDQATLIADLVLSAAQAEGRAWGPLDLPLTLVRGPAGAPRDRVEIWLPAEDAAAARRDPLELLNVRYYLRDADRDRISQALRGLVEYRVVEARAAPEPVNTLSCHPRLGAPALAEFKTLALALIESGAPIMRVKAFDDPANNSENSVAISFLAAPAGAEPLTRADIEGLTACPATPLTRRGV